MQGNQGVRDTWDLILSFSGRGAHNENNQMSAKAEGDKNSTVRVAGEGPFIRGFRKKNPELFAEVRALNAMLKMLEFLYFIGQKSFNI